MVTDLAPTKLPLDQLAREPVQADALRALFESCLATFREAIEVRSVRTKGDSVSVFKARQTNGLSDVRVDMGHYNAAHVEVMVIGGSTSGISATVALRAMAADVGVAVFPLQDINAVQVGVTANLSFDCLIASRYCTLELLAVTGGFLEGNGFYATITPYLAAGSTAPPLDPPGLESAIALGMTIGAAGATRAVEVTSTGHLEVAIPTELLEQILEQLTMLNKYFYG